MSYYKYKERVSADQEAVDYSLIQSGAQEGFEAIQEEQSRKQADKEVKIAELREAASKEILAAEDAVRTNKGDKSKDSFNAQVLSMAHQSAQHMKALEKLMRAGKINPSDFAIQRQNLTDSVTQLRVVTAAYKDSVNQAVQRQQSMDGKQPQAGALEAFNMSEVQKIIDLKDRSLSVDPVTGMVRMSHIDGSSVSMGEVQVRMMNKYDRYDLKEGAAKYAKDVGLVTIQDGRVTIADAFTEVDDRDLDKTIRTTWVDGLSNEAQASVLLDSSGGYEAVQADNQAELDRIVKSKGLDREKVVWLQPNYETEGGRLNAEFTPDQRDEIGNKSVDMMRTLLPYKKTERAPTPPSAGQMARQDKKAAELDKARVDADLLYDIYTGDSNVKSRALSAYELELKDQYGDQFRKIEVVDGQLQITVVKTMEDDSTRDEVVKVDMEAGAGGFRKFVQTIGKKLAGERGAKIISMYDDIDTGQYTGDYNPVDATFEIEVTDTPSPKQKLVPLVNMGEAIDSKIKAIKQDWRTSEETAFSMYEEAIGSLISEMGAEGVEVSRLDDKLTVTLPQGTVLSLTLTEDANTKVKAKTLLRKVHSTLTLGEDSSGGTTGGTTGGTSR